MFVTVVTYWATVSSQCGRSVLMRNSFGFACLRDMVHVPRSVQHLAQIL